VVTENTRLSWLRFGPKLDLSATKTAVWTCPGPGNRRPTPRARARSYADSFENSVRETGDEKTESLYMRVVTPSSTKAARWKRPHRRLLCLSSRCYSSC
jgi:hypothetical protein